MLVIGRNDGESLRIGDAVVKIVWSKLGKVRLGIEAPDSVVVTRSELELVEDCARPDTIHRQSVDAFVGIDRFRIELAHIAGESVGASDVRLSVDRDKWTAEIIRGPEILGEGEGVMPHNAFERALEAAKNRA